MEPREPFLVQDHLVVVFELHDVDIGNNVTGALGVVALSGAGIEVLHDLEMMTELDHRAPSASASSLYFLAWSFSQ